MGADSWRGLRKPGRVGKIVPVVLDAYIIEEIKREEEARRQGQADSRPRLRIEHERPLPPRDDPSTPDEDEGPIRIDIDAPTIRIGSSRLDP